jgi:hypothetical protein
MNYEQIISEDQPAHTIAGFIAFVFGVRDKSKLPKVCKNKTRGIGMPREALERIPHPLLLALTGPDPVPGAGAEP